VLFWHLYAARIKITLVQVKVIGDFLEYQQF
jgi:hypothetical protein